VINKFFTRTTIMKTRVHKLNKARTPSLSIKFFANFTQNLNKSRFYLLFFFRKAMAINPEVNNKTNTTYIDISPVNFS
jgi:hypothetical protein